MHLKLNKAVNLTCYFVICSIYMHLIFLFEHSLHI